MTIQLQWLIFIGVCVGLFTWGLFAKNRESDAKEEHTAVPITETQHEAALHETAHV